MHDGAGIGSADRKAGFLTACPVPVLRRERAMRIVFTEHYHCRRGHDHKPGDICDLPEHVAAKLKHYGIATVAPEKQRAVSVPAPDAGEVSQAPKSAAKKAR